jgi:valyl-tRNA synthetase
VIDERTEKELEWLQNIIASIRTIRSENNISPGKPLSILLCKGTETDRKNHYQHERLLLALAKLESIRWLGPTEAPPRSATAFVGELEIRIPMAEFMNIEEERARLIKEITKVQKEILFSENKLSPQFVNKAPTQVVAKENEALTKNLALRAKLQGELNLIEEQSAETPTPPALRP